MSKRTRLMTFLVLSLLAASMFYTGSLYAQEEEPVPWSVILLNGQTDEMAKVYLDGTVEISAFPVPGGAGVVKAFSADGNLMILSMYDEARDASVLYIHDFLSGTTFDPGIERVSIGAFSPDGTLFALSVQNYYPGEEGADTSLPEWELWVIDAVTGEIVHQIDADAFDMEAFGLMSGFWPVVTAYPTPDEVVFFAAPSTGAMPAFRWVLSAGTFEPVEAYGKVGFLTLGSEKVWIDASEDWPLDDALPMSGNRTNVVMYANEAGESYEIFTAPAVGSATFINEGHHLVISTLTYDAETNEIFTEWVVLGRDGTTFDLPEVSDSYYWPINAPSGYLEIYVERAEGRIIASVTLLYHQMDGSGVIELWQDTSGDYWRAMWAAPVLTEELEPFTPLSVAQ